MKVRCIDNQMYFDDLTIGSTYDVIAEHDCSYAVKNDCGYAETYPKCRFEPVEESKPIRIKKWEDLDEVKNDKYSLEVGISRKINAISVFDTISWLFDFPYRVMDQSIVLSILRQFGFEVEFVKPVELTEADKLMVKALLAYGYHWITKDKHVDYASAHKIKPCMSGSYWDSNCESANLIPEVFNFLTWEDDPICLDDLDMEVTR